MSSTAFEIGVAKTTIAPPPHGIGMMGWGQLTNVVHGARTPLHARAFVLRDAETTVALVCCELAFISLAVKQAVCDRLARDHAELGLSEVNLMLMATHTHSGPGGFTHYPFYNVTIPGFVPEVVEIIVEAIVGALVQAHARLAPGRVRYGEDEFPPDVPVAFNRAVESYNLNPEVQTRSLDEPHLALDRRMRMLRFEDDAGTEQGALNWFAVHCTSVHSDNAMLHFDNKGYAAQMLEDRQRAAGHPGFVGAFAQGAAGDVTPNHRRYTEKPWTRGAHLDDDESARDNGRLQLEQAQRVLQRAADAPVLEGPLDAAHAFVDFSDVQVDPRHADGQTGRRTGPAEIGWAMLFGTEEGPGLPRGLLFVQRWAGAALRRLGRGAPTPDHAEVQGEKFTALETGRRRVLGVSRLRALPLPWRLHPALRMVRELDETDRPDPHPWTPQVLPIQILRVGPIAIAAVPAEFTTASGLRLRASIKAALAGAGVQEVILAGYANAYAGYVTTAQEYARQDYEGASTHFGTWTLAAYQTRFDELAADLCRPRASRTNRPGPRPPVFTAADLAERRYRPRSA